MGSELSGKWRKVTLGEIIDLKYGFGLPERTRKGGNIPVYGSSGIVGWHDEATVKDLHFVYYLLKAQDFTYLNSDSAVHGLNRNAAYGVEVLLPPFSEQCRIASILSAFDDKIELNEQMNRTLEEMASAIFKSWFVDFEPFQDSEFEYNEKLEKEIPKGWEVKPFSEVIDVNPKRMLKKGVLAKKVGMADLNVWQSWIESCQIEEYKSGSRFQNGDILFA